MKPAASARCSTASPSASCSSLPRFARPARAMATHERVCSRPPNANGRLGGMSPRSACCWISSMCFGSHSTRRYSVPVESAAVYLASASADLLCKIFLKDTPRSPPPLPTLDAPAIAAFASFNVMFFGSSSASSICLMT
eukprot:2741853-Prymnesium_polylepis.1